MFGHGTPLCVSAASRADSPRGITAFLGLFFFQNSKPEDTTG